MPLISETVNIAASPAEIWQAITEPATMARWMGEPEMDIKVHTSWEPASPYVVTGFHHARFENKGQVLTYDAPRQLSYSHFSSISRLPDVEENYSIIAFTLTPGEGYTQLALTIRNFPTDVIFRHLQFYWRTTIIKIKQLIEGA
ncbi:SRPBCC family protein [Chitinophaga vietnamensis]|uniref:SRPBCC family protein n=1 Tax=Chitinophaga vietnamensis TaxID=2593957 RepID=UPI001177C571|nr:SRPBCC domain-containing protein [Chitinophaga vietnamensis]